MIGDYKWSCLRRAATPATLARWLVRGALAGLGAASCLCAGSAPTTAPQRAEPAASATPAPTPVPASVPVSPERLAGDWLFEVTRGGEPVQFSLHFAVNSGVLAGSLTGPDGNIHELSKIAYHEDKLSWDVPGDTQTLHYEGTFSGDSMKGTVKRSAGNRSGGGRGGDSGQGSEGSSGGGGFSGGGRGRGHRSGGRGGGQAMTWSAYKSVATPPGEQPGPETSPTAGPSGR
jgi:hypothetical protein